MKENSVVAQKIVYEGIKKESGVLQVNVTKQMITDVKNAWRYAKAAEDANRENQTAGDARREQQKRLSKEINDTIAAKKKAAQAISKITSAYDAKILHLTESLKK